MKLTNEEQVKAKKISEKVGFDITMMAAHIGNVLSEEEKNFVVGVWKRLFYERRTK